MTEKEDPIKMHKDANNLMETGKLKEARELFLRTAELYKKKQNYFDSTTMLYKAGDCAISGVLAINPAADSKQGTDA